MRPDHFYPSTFSPSLLLARMNSRSDRATNFLSIHSWIPRSPEIDIFPWFYISNTLQRTSTSHPTRNTRMKPATLNIYIRSSSSCSPSTSPCPSDPTPTPPPHSPHLPPSSQISFLPPPSPSSLSQQSKPQNPPSAVSDAPYNHHTHIYLHLPGGTLQRPTQRGVINE